MRCRLVQVGQPAQRRHRARHLPLQDLDHLAPTTRSAVQSSSTARHLVRPPLRSSTRLSSFSCSLLLPELRPPSGKSLEARLQSARSQAAGHPVLHRRALTPACDSAGP